jgi:hypothetical protein
MPSEDGMTYPASSRQTGQVRRASIARASAPHLRDVIGRTGFAQSTR